MIESEPLNYAEVVMFGDGAPCPNPGCRHYMTHPCEMCGRTACRGVVDLRMGWLRVWKEEEIEEKKEREFIP